MTPIWLHRKKLKGSRKLTKVWSRLYFFYAFFDWFIFCIFWIYLLVESKVLVFHILVASLFVLVFYQFFPALEEIFQCWSSNVISVAKNTFFDKSSLFASWWTLETFQLKTGSSCLLFLTDSLIWPAKEAVLTWQGLRMWRAKLLFCYMSFIQVQIHR